LRTLRPFSAGQHFDVHGTVDEIQIAAPVFEHPLDVGVGQSRAGRIRIDPPVAFPVFSHQLVVLFIIIIYNRFIFIIDFY
jgi:hypothetical protein